MKYNKKLWLLALSLFGSGSSYAAYISPEEAARSAIVWKQMRTVGLEKLTLLPEPIYQGNILSNHREATVRSGDTLASENEYPAYYVFNYPDNAGFVILSADDTLTPVLGYSDSGNFNPAAIPANMKVWLDGYVSEISAYLSRPSGVKSVKSTRAESDRAAIPPMITTKWNQDSPYNTYCPTIKGTKAPTGCTATALAQIMNYYKWPQGKGNDSWSYTRDGYTAEFDFGNTAFDWDNMTDTYSSSSSAEARDAVATLMKACGVVTDMFYGSNESGAYMFYIPENLQHYLGYAPGARYVLRSHYDNAAWEELIYNELAAGRPVQYEGYASAGGHSFVVDGYLGNHFFHLNWGWGGLSDGYYVLSALNPGEQGIGSYEGGYNSDQAAVVGLRPDDGTPAEEFVSVYTEGPVSLMQRPALRLRNYTVHSSVNSHDVDFAVKFVTTEGEPSETLLPSSQTLTMGGYIRGQQEFWYGTGQLLDNGIIPFEKEDIASLPAGTYHVYPMYKAINMDWTPLPVSNGLPYVAVSLSPDGSMKELEEESGAFNLSAIALSETKLYVWNDGTSGPSIGIAMTNHSSGDFLGTLSITFIQEGKTAPTARGTMSASIPAGRTSTLTYDSTFPTKEGNYKVRITDEEGMLLGELPLSIGVVKKSDLFVYYAELPSHIYEKTDFRRQKLALWYYNSSSELREMKPEIRVVATNDFSNALRVTDGTKRTMKADEVIRLEYGSWNLGQGNDYLKAGDYYLQVYNSLDDTPMSLPIPVKVWKEEDNDSNLFVGAHPDGSAYIVAPSTSPSIAGRPTEAYYEGVLDIPAYATVNGEDLPVASIARDALMMANLDGVVLRSGHMDFAHLAVALSNVGRNSSALYLMPEFYDLQRESAEAYGIESYVLMDGYNMEVTEGNLESITPDAPVKGIVNCSPITRVLYEQWDRNFTFTSTNPDITASYAESGIDGGGVAVEIRVKAATDKGNVTITPRQPYSEPIVLAINGGDDASVEDTPLDTMRVEAHDGIISVFGATSGAEISVFSLNGGRIESAIADEAGKCRLKVSANGVYIVKTGLKVMKVMM